MTEEHIKKKRAPFPLYSSIACSENLLVNTGSHGIVNICDLKESCFIKVLHLGTFSSRKLTFKFQSNLYCADWSSGDMVISEATEIITEDRCQWIHCEHLRDDAIVSATYNPDLNLLFAGQYDGSVAVFNPFHSLSCSHLLVEE